MSDKHAALLARLDDNLPLDLASLRDTARWVLWRYEKRDGTATKVPYSPDGRHASSTDPGTWATYDEAFAVLDGDTGDRFDGIGLVMVPDDDLIGVDFDHVTTSRGVLIPEVRDFIENTGCYAEWTPSGEGVRVYVRGSLPEWSKHRGKLHHTDAPRAEVEVYEADRYFTLTGDKFATAGDAVWESQAELDVLLDTYLRRPAPRAAEPVTSTAPIPADDAALLEVIYANAGTGHEFRRRYEQGASPDEDRSAVDLWFGGQLAFWTQRDAARMDRLFRRSALMRAKWDAPARSGETYGEGTIREAIAACSSVYEPQAAMPATRPPAPLPEGFTLAGLLDDIEAYLRTFVALPSDDAAAVLALYVAHTAVIEAFDCTPYLFIRSPEPRCGKTALLSCLERVMPYSLQGVGWTEATLFRSIMQDGARHVLLLDEVDQLLGKGSDGTDPRAAIINAGNQRGARVPRMVERKGGGYEPEWHDAFCPKVLAGIDTGNLLPATLDRCIIINMVRADEADRESLSRPRARAVEAKAAPLREALRSWGATAEDELATLDPAAIVEDIPGLSARAVDGAEPLLMVAHLAGPECYSRARQAVTALCAPGDTTGSLTQNQQVLLDLFRVFVLEEGGTEALLPASYLCERMRLLDDSPWGRIGLDEQGLGFRMKAYMADWSAPRKRFHGRFGVRSENPVKAYPIEHLIPLWEKYLPPRVKDEFGVDERLDRIRVASGVQVATSTALDPSQVEGRETGSPKGVVQAVPAVQASQRWGRSGAFDHFNPLVRDYAARLLDEREKGLDLFDTKAVQKALDAPDADLGAVGAAQKAALEHLAAQDTGGGGAS